MDINYKSKIIISPQINNYGAGKGTAWRETQRQVSQTQGVSWNNMMFLATEHYGYISAAQKKPRYNYRRKCCWRLVIQITSWFRFHIPNSSAWERILGKYYLMPGLLPYLLLDFSDPHQREETDLKWAWIWQDHSQENTGYSRTWVWTIYRIQIWNSEAGTESKPLAPCDRAPSTGEDLLQKEQAALSKRLIFS